MGIPEAPNMLWLYNVYKEYRITSAIVVLSDSGKCIVLWQRGAVISVILRARGVSNDFSACVQHAALFVNVKGCGYPPTVRCDSWIEEYGVLGSRYYRTCKKSSHFWTAHRKKCRTWMRNEPLKLMKAFSQSAIVLLFLFACLAVILNLIVTFRRRLLFFAIFCNDAPPPLVS